MAHDSMNSNQKTTLQQASGAPAASGQHIVPQMRRRDHAAPKSKVPSPTAARRCAIYTRKSSEEGLDQDFNSLQAQREACEAYIASQRHEGWVLNPAIYDDGGYSGGSMERPGLKALMAEVVRGRIDIVVVYKVDRLTRSLTDFARIVEQFDAGKVSFVSVTQSFNTTTSMGRLTLNVLLSFAQFEREVTTERIRDKIAASKRKGIFMGGPVPLGYRVDQRKLLIVEEEAETVRLIFKLYLELKSVLAVKRELDFRQLRTRVRHRRNGSSYGGIAFFIGTISAILRNRVYIGETVHKGQYFDGEHQPVLDQSLFDTVQAMLGDNTNGKARTTHRMSSLLTGKIFDSNGNRMKPASSNKNGLRYTYYCSRALFDKLPKDAGDPARASARTVDGLVLDALRTRFAQLQQKSEDYKKSGIPDIADKFAGNDSALIDRYLERVEIYKDCISITFTEQANHPSEDLPRTIRVRWSSAKKQRSEIIEAPAATSSEPAAHYLTRGNRQRLVQAIAKAHSWIDDLNKGRLKDLDAIAEHEGKSLRNIRMMINLAFLAPDIIKAALNGTLPESINATEIAQQLPVDWNEQRRLVGLA